MYVPMYPVITAGAEHGIPSGSLATITTRISRSTRLSLELHVDWYLQIVTRRLLYHIVICFILRGALLCGLVR